jgi:SAM-dependent methyltransferase
MGCELDFGYRSWFRVYPVGAPRVQSGEGAVEADGDYNEIELREILDRLAPGQKVLDLGSSGHGSFREEECAGLTIRCDLSEEAGKLANFVRCDAGTLPFASQSFDAVILNHSLEHFEDPGKVLDEIGRILRHPGCLWVAVPDASTVSDRVYRWVAHGGGHVNQFSDVDALMSLIERRTSLSHAHTRLLFSSYSFLNQYNGARGYGRRIYLFGGGREWLLRLFTFCGRKIDRFFGTRISVYGWGCTFGPVTGFNDDVWTNVCVRCGAGYSSAWLVAAGKAWRTRLGVRAFRCPACSAKNYLTDDRPVEGIAARA